MKNSIIAVICLFAVLVLMGCSGKNNPGVFPFSVKITEKGTAISGAIVAMYSSDGKGKSSSGLTGSDGVAKLETVEGWNGAFPGEYVVTVSKSENVFIPDPTPESPDGTRAERKQLLPETYRNAETSPFKVTVEAKKGTATFDIP